LESRIIFPIQLYQNHTSLQVSPALVMIEEWFYFKQYIFHQHKIVLHRASMQQYYSQLKQQGYQVNYVESIVTESDIRLLITQLAEQGVTTIHYVDVVDNWLQQRIATSCKKARITTTIYPTPNFLNDIESANEYFNKKKSYFQTEFYIWQRKNRKLLVEKDGSPIGGKWTFDTDNRLKFPKNTSAPFFQLPAENSFIVEAKTYTKKYFGQHYGDANLPMLSAINHKDAADWLQQFLQYRFKHFGIYEDAMVAKENILHHSVLSPMLNIGLLTPQQVINAAIDAAIQYEVPMNSLEGFVRQIIGWREFIRIVYERAGSKQRTTNYWGFTRKIPSSFWTGETGIVPIDTVIKRTLQTGYCHHIERLMVLGNFMLLCEFDPDEVHRWFMELFIDAYDWVMVPNVYGMTQFADGGLMTTKPYISGSNYILKMSDFEKGNWQAIWDGLFWRFMVVHKAFFQQNPRLGMLLKTFEKMSAEKQQTHLNNAENFLAQLDK